MTVKDSLQLLDITTPFSRADLKKAYSQALKVWHPDRFQPGDELQGKAHQKTRLIIEAFDCLSRALGTSEFYPQPSEPNRQGDIPATSRKQEAKSQVHQTNESPSGGFGATNAKAASSGTTSSQGSVESRQPKTAVNSCLVSLLVAGALFFGLIITVAVVGKMEQPKNSRTETVPSSKGASQSKNAAEEDQTRIEALIAEANNGNADVQNSLGLRYLRGEGVPKDAVEALKWFRKAADQGDANAEYSVGMSYAEGVGVIKNMVEAVKWFRKAAEKGNPVAQFSLGFCYVVGEGIARDDVEAANWFRKSADQGNVDAFYHLGESYAHGEGVAQDAVEAYKWFKLAAAQGNADAGEERATIEKQMTAEQIAEAQKLAREWKPKSATPRGNVSPSNASSLESRSQNTPKVKKYFATVWVGRYDFETKVTSDYKSVTLYADFTWTSESTIFKVNDAFKGTDIVATFEKTGDPNAKSVALRDDGTWRY